MPSEPSREKFPFEPRQKKKKSPKAPSPSGIEAKKNTEASLNAIPDVVSKRMARRMAIFCGIPTSLGMSSFFIFYWIVSHDWFKVPSYAVVSVSLSLFVLGILGLSYGIFSASWDEERAGSWWGWEEFKINSGRTFSAWRSNKKEVK